MNVTFKIAVFASGSGTNAENLVKIFNQGQRIHIGLVLCNRKNAGVYERMERLGVKCEYVPNQVWDNDPQQIVDILKENRIDIIVLAGFMHYVSPLIINAYKGQIINIHPSLLPAHGGKGMWGHHVHEAVIAAGDAKSGVTVHHVTEDVDGGEIIMQESVDVMPDDTAETLEAKIHPIEYRLYPRALMRLCETLEAEQQNQPKEPIQEWAEVLKVKYEPQSVPPPIPTAEPAPAMQQPAMQQQRPAVQQNAAAPTTDATEPMPPSYLALAVIMMICCCVPGGIVALIYASQVGKKYYSGDIEGAKRSSYWAQVWIIVSFSVGLLLNTFFMPLYML